MKIRKGDGDMYPLRVINPKWGDKEWTPSEEDWWRDHIAGVDVVATRGDGTCVGCLSLTPRKKYLQYGRRVISFVNMTLLCIGRTTAGLG